MGFLGYTQEEQLTKLSLDTDAVDWGNGLPLDVLALVANLGGISDTLSMRGVNKCWQQGFELGVQNIKIHFNDRMLPAGGEVAVRFPGLTNLDLGEVRMSAKDWLKNMRGIASLNSLSLGQRFPPNDKHRISNSLATNLTRDALEHLRGLPLTCLNLNGCTTFGDVALEFFQGIPLRVLDLSRCQFLSKDGMGNLIGMPLSVLRLRECRGISPEGLDGLKGMPLSELDLTGSVSLLCDAGLDCLRGLPLTVLHLGLVGGDPWGWLGLQQGSSPLTDLGLENLQTMPLVTLTLRGLDGITDSGLENLKGMALTSLSICECSAITLGCMELFVGMPFTQLELRDFNDDISGQLRFLKEMPLTSLDLGGCDPVQYPAFEMAPGSLCDLKFLPLTHLGLAGEKNLTTADLADLSNVPLTSLDIGYCRNVSGAMLEETLRRLPSLKRLRLVGCGNVDADCLNRLWRVYQLWH